MPTSQARPIRTREVEADLRLGVCGALGAALDRDAERRGSTIQRRAPTT